MGQHFTYRLLPLIFVLAACQPQVPVLPAEHAPIATLLDPACPNLSGTYALFGKPLEGMPDYYRKVTVKLTLDRMLGMDVPSEDVVKPVEVKVVQDDTIELSGYPTSDGYARRFELLPGDTVACSYGEMTIRQLRETRGYSDEQQWRITKTARRLALDVDGALVVKTSIRAQSKSALIAYEDPLEVYGARFARIN
ncbi:MAG: hypothetical protein ABW047_04695 [Nitrospiraceae bacterium]